MVCLGCEHGAAGWKVETKSTELWRHPINNQSYPWLFLRLICLSSSIQNVPKYHLCNSAQSIRSLHLFGSLPMSLIWFSLFFLVHVSLSPFSLSSLCIPLSHLLIITLNYHSFLSMFLFIYLSTFLSLSFHVSFSQCLHLFQLLFIALTNHHSFAHRFFSSYIFLHFSLSVFFSLCVSLSVCFSLCVFL